MLGLFKKKEEDRPTFRSSAGLGRWLVQTYLYSLIVLILVAVIATPILFTLWLNGMDVGPIPCLVIWMIFSMLFTPILIAPTQLRLHRHFYKVTVDEGNINVHKVVRRVPLIHTFQPGRVQEVKAQELSLMEAIKIWPKVVGPCIPKKVVWIKTDQRPIDLFYSFSWIRYLHLYKDKDDWVAVDVDDPDEVVKLVQVKGKGKGKKEPKGSIYRSSYSNAGYYKFYGTTMALLFPLFMVPAIALGVFATIYTYHFWGFFPLIFLVGTVLFAFGAVFLIATVNLRMFQKEGERYKLIMTKKELYIHFRDWDVQVPINNIGSVSQPMSPVSVALRPFKFVKWLRVASWGAENTVSLQFKEPYFILEREWPGILVDADDGEGFVQELEKRIK